MASIAINGLGRMGRAALKVLDQSASAGTETVATVVHGVNQAPAAEQVISR